MVQVSKTFAFILVIIEDPRWMATTTAMRSVTVAIVIIIVRATVAEMVTRMMAVMARMRHNAECKCGLVKYSIDLKIVEIR